MCGKNAVVLVCSSALTGSPPRVREKLTHSVLVAVVAGITPACAGKTLARFKKGVIPWDHPRVCGKNDELFGDIAKYVGSPPRVREKRR